MKENLKEAANKFLVNRNCGIITITTGRPSKHYLTTRELTNLLAAFGELVIQEKKQHEPSIPVSEPKKEDANLYSIDHLINALKIRRSTHAYISMDYLKKLINP